ncbi:hypothetical protein FF1_022648 [Malus domestica]
MPTLEHHIEAAVDLDCGFYEEFDLVLVGHVAVDVNGVVRTDRCDYVLAFVVLNIGNNHGTCAMQGKFPCGCFTDATGSTSDDCDLSLKLLDGEHRGFGRAGAAV